MDDPTALSLFSHANDPVMKRITSFSSQPALQLAPYRCDIERCVKCGTCSAVCPTFLRERGESQSPRGRMALVKAVLEGKLTLSAIFKDRLATCTTCLACEVSCPNNVPVTKIIQAAKEQAAVESGIGMINRIIMYMLQHPVASRATAWLAPTVLHYGKGDSKFKVQSAKREKIGVKRKKSERVVFFPGCAISLLQKDIERAVISVLGRLGIEVIIPGGFQCCGRPVLSLGARGAAERIVAHNSAIFEAFQADAIVTACASCSLTFKKEYPKLLRPSQKVPVVLDIHEFLARMLPTMPMGFVRRTVTYHDACHLGRGQGLSGTVRGILRSIPGITLIEMNNADSCCGFGGVMRITHQKLSDGIAEDKAKNIIATKASAVITGCPGCRMQIASALNLAGFQIEVLHTIHMVEAALGNAEMARSRYGTTGAGKNMDDDRSKK
jgi:glycolate oxidase iron-sulfur subunit